MATLIALNLIASIAVVAGLAAVCRFAYTAGAKRSDDRAVTVEPALWHEPERRAA